MGLAQDYNPALAAAAEEKKKLDQEILAGNAYRMTPDLVRIAGISNYGQIQGAKAFETPEMMQMQRLREDLAKGYSGEAGGALRQQARGEIAGQQQAQARKLASAQARGGVGGARGAAMQAASAREGGKAVAEAERKMALDSFQMQQKGADSLQDYLFRKTFAKLGSGAAYASMGSAQYAAEQAAKANKQSQPGFLSWLFG